MKRAKNYQKDSLSTQPVSIPPYNHLPNNYLKSLP